MQIHSHIYFAFLCAAFVKCDIPLVDKTDILTKSEPASESKKLQTISVNPPAEPHLLSSIMSVAKVLPASSNPPYRLRSVLRNFYFTYRFYEPELLLAKCVMQFAGNPEFKVIDRVNDSVRENASEYMRSLIDRLASSFEQFFNTLVCDGSLNDKQQCIKELSRRQEKSVLNTNNKTDDGTMDVFRVIMLNAAEKWLRSIRMLQPIIESISSVDIRMVGHYLTGELERSIERLSELLLPGLFICTKRYSHQFVWRMFESWL